MADDYRAPPIYRSVALRPLDRHPADTPYHQQSHLPPHAYEPPPGRPVVHDAAYVARILDLDVSHLTGDVLRAVAPVLAQLEALRTRAEQAEHRLAWMERQSDRHSLVPCLTRRAFMREVDAFLIGGGHGVVALVSLTGIETLRRRYGLAAADDALRHAAAALIGSLRASDLIGCLGSGDFGLLLAGAEPAGAGDKVATIVRRIETPPFQWDGADAGLAVAWGVAAHPVPMAGDAVAVTPSAEAMVADADRDLRSMWPYRART